MRGGVYLLIQACGQRHFSQIISVGVGFQRSGDIRDSGPLVAFRTYAVFTVSQNLNLNRVSSCPINPIKSYIFGIVL